MSAVQDFVQDPPRLGNQYEEDRVLRSYLGRALPPAVLAEVEPELREMGELAAGELLALQAADRPNEPRLTRWSAWGERIDEIELTPLWRRAKELAARSGLVAAAYERRHGSLSRLHQFALVHLFHPSTDVYTCPLAMTDGAAKTLTVHRHEELLARALPRLAGRDPATAWTSGQWMTETSGGSDVGRSLTVARQEGETWRLYGRKWFTSAVSSEMALTLARPEGNPPGGRGLALFYLETARPDGRPNGIRVERLKDKLGTRKLPTAELFLEGAAAVPVRGTADGVRAIAPMLNVTRLWNAVSAVSFMRRGIALARDYARRREAFGAPLAEQPLHRDTLAGLQAEYEAAFHLTFRVAELLGREEAGELATGEELLLRVLTPVAKLTTGKQAVAVTSECLECFGGAGYLEDTGLPALLRDAQVLPIWEGTTNVLSLDTLRAIGRDTRDLEGGFGVLLAEVYSCMSAIRDVELAVVADGAIRTIERARYWLEEAAEESRVVVEAGARRFALTLGRSLALVLLARHAQWSLDEEGDARPRAAARRFAAAGTDLLTEVDRTSLPGRRTAGKARAEAQAEAAALAEDRALPTEPVA
ncbi:MAG TPA: acyl-CoA dehydrogenase family protein [Thermoanaerobaculia bacterium]|nr:acyl-CoA dehydrogenase family protein [Thermoanaerobaculia bacterium]